MLNQWLFSMPSPLSPMKSDEPLIALVGKFSMEPAYCEKKRKEQRERGVKMMKTCRIKMMAWKWFRKMLVLVSLSLSLNGAKNMTNWVIFNSNSFIVRKCLYVYLLLLHWIFIFFCLELFHLLSHTVTPSILSSIQWVKKKHGNW